MRFTSYRLYSITTQLDITFLQLQPKIAKAFALSMQRVLTDKRCSVRQTQYYQRILRLRYLEKIHHSTSFWQQCSHYCGVKKVSNFRAEERRKVKVKTCQLEIIILLPLCRYLDQITNNMHPAATHTKLSCQLKKNCAQ